MVTGYCVKCKKKGVTMSNARQTKSAKGTDMIRGTCPNCGTKMVKFGRM